MFLTALQDLCLCAGTACAAYHARVLCVGRTVLVAGEDTATRRRVRRLAPGRAREWHGRCIVARVPKGDLMSPVNV